MRAIGHLSPPHNPALGGQYAEKRIGMGDGISGECIKRCAMLRVSCHLFAQQAGST